MFVIIIKFGFCDIPNNQGLGKCYHPWPSARLVTLNLDLDYSGYHKNFIQQLFTIVVSGRCSDLTVHQICTCACTANESDWHQFSSNDQFLSKRKGYWKWSLREGALIFFIKYSQLVLKEISEFSVANLFVNTTMCMHDYYYYYRSVNASDIHNNQTSPD